MSDGKFKEKKIPEWNLIGRIRQAREKNRRQMEEEAAAEVTNTMAENAMKICTSLQSTSFARSKLPKTEPGQEPDQEPAPGPAEGDAPYLNITYAVLPAEEPARLIPIRVRNVPVRAESM